MARTPSENLTGREAQVMEAVWRLGEASAEQIRGELPEPLHDSTVRTVLRVLETKGYVRHEARGKAFVYRASIARQKAQRNALRSMLAQLFSGSAEDLVMRLIEDDRITPEQLDELRRTSGSSSRKDRSAERRGKRKGTKQGEQP
jgi:BlaI family transcriptional regulator, penicillinase repressor